MRHVSHSRRLKTVLPQLGASVFLAGLLVQGAPEDKSSEVGLQQILVETRQEAEEIRQLLGAGEDFGRLARERSSSPNGGYLGKMRLSGLRPEIRDAVKGLSPGQLSPIVEMPFGHMILKHLSEADAEELESTERNLKSVEAVMENVRIATMVSGVDGVENIFRRLPRTPDWSQDLQGICKSSLHAVDFGINDIEGYLGDLQAEAPDQRDLATLVKVR